MLFAPAVNLCADDAGSCFYILFSFLGWGALAICSFGIAALWISPYMTQTLLTFYLDGTGELDQIPVRDYDQEAKRFTGSIF